MNSSDTPFIWKQARRLRHQVSPVPFQIKEDRDHGFLESEPIFSYLVLRNIFGKIPTSSFTSLILMNVHFSDFG